MNLTKNHDYTLHYIDPETGYGLLYSQNQDNCVFLNPIATILWKIPTDSVDPSRESRLFAEVFKIHGAAEYLKNVVLDMYKSGLLLSSDGRSQVGEDASKKTINKDYTLDQIYFYVTMECNSRCYHCYQPTTAVKSDYQQRQTDKISKETFLEFVKNTLPLGLKHIKITGGEPLLRDDIEDIIRGIRNLGISVAIETNGFLINETVADMLAEQKVEVSISLDGGSAAVHDSLRGFPGSFERAIKAIRMLSDRECEFQVIMSISRKNMDEVENTINIASINGCRLVKLNPVNTIGIAQRLQDRNILLTAGELITLYKKWKELESKFKIFLFVDLPPSFASLDEIVSGHTGMCPFTNMLGVLPDGSISFCGIGNSCRDTVFGRIGNEGFEIQRFWQEAEPLVHVRYLLLGKLEGVCELCVFESFCKGHCRAFAYGESKSFLASHPWCQNAFNAGLFPHYYLKSQKKEVK